MKVTRNAARPLAPLALFIGMVVARPAAQEVAGAAEEMAVVEVVQRLFDGMRAGDSARVRSTFTADARLMSTAIREGEPLLRSVEIDRFVEAVGQPHDEVWDERIWDTEVRVDGVLATVWTRYAFYVGPRLSHCGVDAFQLFRASEGWRIFQIADTRHEAASCEDRG